MRKNIVKKCVETFFDIAENEENYKVFYEQFGKNLKLGIHEDEQNRAKLTELLRFQSTKKKEGLGTSLKDYVSRMQENQKDIYYITGESLKAVENAPFLEKLKAKDYEVLFLVDPIDEYMIQQLKEFDGKKLLSITKDGLKLDESEEDKKTFEELKLKTEDFCKLVKETLGDKIDKAVCSERIVKSPCCLVTSEYGWSANMERIMRAQALRDSSMSSHMMSKKIMEVNPSNKVIKALVEKVSVDRTDNSIKDFIWLLYESSLLSSGFSLEDPNVFVDRLQHILAVGLSVDTLEEPEVTVVNETNVVETNSSTMEQVD
jgi:molecular chaperone HtpG